MWATPTLALLASPPLAAGLHFLAKSSRPTPPPPAGRSLEMNFDDIVLGDYARRLITRKAQSLVRRPGFENDDCGDIEQELIQWLLLGLPLFDPFHSHVNVFVTTVIERAVARMIRRRRAKKRDAGCVRSIDSLQTDDGHSFEPADPRDHQREVDLAIDLADLLACLPDKARRLAKRLVEAESTAEVANDLGVSQSTIWRQVAAIRRQFEDAGLRDYL
jgi:RNA polymerase sigma factor (sigma-70 family)